MRVGPGLEGYDAPCRAGEGGRGEGGRLEGRERQQPGGRYGGKAVAARHLLRRVLVGEVWAAYLRQRRMRPCLSRKPADLRELQDMLVGEAYHNFEREYCIESECIQQSSCSNRSQFAHYEVYLSQRAVVYIDKKFAPAIEERIDGFADYLFIVILTLFQNTALAKAAKRVTGILEESTNITPETKLIIDREYGATVRFWEMQNFKYLSSQLEAAQLAGGLRQSTAARCLQRAAGIPRARGGIAGGHHREPQRHGDKLRGHSAGGSAAAAVVHRAATGLLPGDGHSGGIRRDHHQPRHFEWHVAAGAGWCR